MTTKKISLFLFIDALGWEILQQNPTCLKNLLPYRKPLRTIFGYSSACDPSIISGRLPSSHLHFSSYYYSPETSPFRNLGALKYLPSFPFDSGRVRWRMSQLVGKYLGIDGYFHLYNVPFDLLPFFDYAEKKRIYEPNGLIEGASIFDQASEQGLPYHVSGPGFNDKKKLEELKSKLKERKISFAYVTQGKLDALMHSYGPYDACVEKYLKYLEDQILDVVAVAERNYDEVSCYLFSDHGMHLVKETCNLQRAIQALPLTFGKDYVVFYDSTMARFWFLNENAKKSICSALSHVTCGKILSDTELKELGVYFEDQRYGELFYLMQGGVLIVPSFMGRKRIMGMHGYHPDEADSSASIMSNKEIPENLKSIEQIYQIMCEESGIKQSLLSSRS